MAFSFTNKKGKTYFLHERNVTLRGNNRQQRIFFFSAKEEGGMDAVPEGYAVHETESSGLPVLKKVKQPEAGS